MPPVITPHDARAKFTKGQRVTVSAEGMARHISRGHPTGVVVGFGRNGQTVIVRPDGVQTPTSFHRDFWDAET